MALADNILAFLFNLKLPFELPPGVGILDVHKDDKVRGTCEAFYKKFYSNSSRRHLILGINPGRFGGGVTGIPFTDPIRLEAACGIANDFKKKQELSSVFMYEMMEAFGGLQQFYNSFYISSIVPLGFVKDGKNLNYYDDAVLKKIVEPFVVDSIYKQLAWGLHTDICYCLGEGENLKYLKALNEKYKWFGQINGLPHPRFIMQYKLKQKHEYLNRYTSILTGQNT